MNSSYFGSFGKRTFCDLFELNVRTVHKDLHIFEIINCEVINHLVIPLPITEEVEDGFVPSCFKKIKNSSYMLGLLTDDSSKVLYENNKISLIDTYENRPLQYCIDRNKEYVLVEVQENIIGVRVGKKQRVYIDEFNSLTETPMSEYEEYKTEKEIYLNIMNYKKD